jgi:hypothetical protein
LAGRRSPRRSCFGRCCISFEESRHDGRSTSAPHKLAKPWA